VGSVLAEAVASDVDMPPFDKSAMDGFAVVAADLADVPHTLPVVQDIPAGSLPTGPIYPGECARIMTGAPVPQGADTVVRIEDTRPGPGEGQVTFEQPVAPRKNICWQAEDVSAGDVLLRSGHVIRPPEVSVLAACGRPTVRVWRKPSVAVLSTGNEVVPVDAVPGPGQIRDANSPHVAARLGRLGIEPTRLGIARDEPKALRDALLAGMEHDVLVLSGGVSMGDYDLAPGLLRELGTNILFDSIAVKPGRPMVFGLRGRTAVFGLPGNPVSVMVGTELFVVPAVKTMMGYGEVHPTRRLATTTAPLKNRIGRIAHVPGVLEETLDGLLATPLPYHGSAHIHAMTRANALLAVPADRDYVEAGETVEVVVL